MSFGIVYIVTGGEKSGTMCLQSVKTLRENGYTGPVLALTENDGWLTSQQGLQIRSQIVSVDDTSPFLLSRRIKTSLFDLSPFDSTLYLDVDTLVQSSIEPIWDSLRTHDLAFALDSFPTWGDLQKKFWRNATLSIDEVLYTRTLCEPSSAYYNGGVMLFRKSPITYHFFRYWHDEWKVFSDKDQPPLARALARSGIPVSILPSTFNSPVQVLDDGSEAIVYHYWKKTRAATPRPAVGTTKRTWKNFIGAIFPASFLNFVRARREAQRLKARLPERLQQSPYRREFL